MKLPGSCVMLFGQEMPIDWIWIGRKLGHLNESPVDEPTLRTTPKPVSGMNVPSPRNSKLFAEPPIWSEPILTVAPSEANFTSTSLGPALALRLKLLALIVR